MPLYQMILSGNSEIPSNTITFWRSGTASVEPILMIDWLEKPIWKYCMLQLFCFSPFLCSLNKRHWIGSPTQSSIFNINAVGNILMMMMCFNNKYVNRTESWEPSSLVTSKWSAFVFFFLWISYTRRQWNGFNYAVMREVYQTITTLFFFS